MDASHIREIQLYSYNQLQFLTERDSDGRKGEGRRGQEYRKPEGGNHSIDCVRNIATYNVTIKLIVQHENEKYLKLENHKTIEAPLP